MPTAAKVERINNSNTGDLNTKTTTKLNTNTANNNNAANQQVQDPTKIVNTIMEKKIRNLEKRKSRLLELKALEDKGQELIPDQVSALKKLDFVAEMVEMFKDVNKILTDSLNEHAKQQKKQQKKEQQDKMIERHQLELEKFKLLIRIFKVLPRIPEITKNLSQQDNASIKLDDKRVGALEHFAEVWNNKENIDNFAEKVHMILDGNKKEYHNGISHLEMKELFVKLVEIDYDDNVQQEQTNETSSKLSPSPDATVDVKESQNKEKETEKSTPASQQLNQVPNEHVEDLQKDPAVIASYAFPSTFSNANCPVNFLNNASGMEFPLIYTAGSIPTQTFTNQNFVSFIPNKIPMFDQSVSLPSQVPMSNTFIRNIEQPSESNDNKIQEQSRNNEHLTNNGGEQVPPEPKPMNTVNNGDLTSHHDNDSKNNMADGTTNLNGTGYHNQNNNKRSTNYRGNNNNRGGPRNFGVGNQNSFRGRNPKNFNAGYFNGGGGGSQGRGGTGEGNPTFIQGGNNTFNGGTRPANRQNGGPAVGGGSRQGGGGSFRGSKERNNNNLARSNNNFNASIAVPANSNVINHHAHHQQ